MIRMIFRFPALVTGMPAMETGRWSLEREISLV